MAYVRSKTIKGKTYRYLVKSVREGKRVRQVFVSYIGNPPPTSGRAAHDAVAAGAGPGVSALPDFTPVMGADVRRRYVRLLQQLGCASVVFSLRAKHKHGELQGERHLETGKVAITKVRLHREASVQAMAHEVGHVLDYVLQNAHGSGGSLDAGFVGHTETLRKLADYTNWLRVLGSTEAHQCLGIGKRTKINRWNSGAESCTGIGVVVGFSALWVC